MKTVEELVNDNERLAYGVASKYFSNVMVDDDDIKQVALIGLYKAAKGFNPDKGAKFSTFAYRVINNEVMKELKRFSTPTASIDEMEMEIPEYQEEYTDTFEQVEVLLQDDEYVALCMFIDGYNQKEISYDLGLSQSQVSRVFIKAKQKVREAVEHGELIG